MHPKVSHALLYTGVNLSATIVDYIVFLTLTHFFGLPILQSAIAYSVATVMNYLLTRNFVFRHDMSHKTEHRRSPSPCSGSS
jgi:putative flippase GtrA